MKTLSRLALEAIVRAIPAGVVVVEKEGKISYANSRAQFILGVDPRGRSLTDYSGRGFKLLTLSGNPYSVQDIPASNALRTGKESRAEMVVERADRSRVVVSASAMPIFSEAGEVTSSVSIIEDITERKMAQEELEEKKDALELAQKVARLGSWEFFVKEDRAVWSEEMFNIFEVEPKVAPNIAAYSKLIHPDDLSMVRKAMDGLIAHGRLGETVNFDYRVLHPDGSVCFLHSGRMVTEVDQSGKALSIVGIEQDITERKKAENALRDSEEKFKLTAEVAHVLVYETKLETGSIVIFRGEDVLGYSKGEIPTEEDWWLRQIHPDDRVQTEHRLRQATDMGTDYSLEYRIKRKDGSYIFARDTGKALRDDQGIVTRFVGGMRDVSERKEAEAALLRSKSKLEEQSTKLEEYASGMEQLAEERARQLEDAQRLAAIGATAGMVGHDIRNPLQAITSDLYLLRDYLASMPQSETAQDVKESLEGIEKNVGYINKIVADLQDYARQLKPECKFINLTEAVRETLKAVEIPDNVKVTNETGHIELRTDPQFVRRALTNLINNAVQAMPNGGNLIIKGQEYVKKNESIVAITVEDTGVGIPDGVKPKLFTPMMTTKSKGQGLGLAVVKRLVEALGGRISFESKEGKGTKFIIELPAIKT